MSRRTKGSTLFFFFLFFFLVLSSLPASPPSAFFRLGRVTAAALHVPDGGDWRLLDGQGRPAAVERLGDWRVGLFDERLEGTISWQVAGSAEPAQVFSLPSGGLRRSPRMAVELDWFLPTVVRPGADPAFPVQVDYRFGPGEALGLDELWNSRASVIWAYFNPSVEPDPSWEAFVGAAGARGLKIHLIVSPMRAFEGTVALSKAAMESVDHPWVRLFVQYRFLADKGLEHLGRCFATLKALARGLAPTLQVDGLFAARYDNGWPAALRLCSDRASSLCMRFVSSDADSARYWGEAVREWKGLPGWKKLEMHAHLGWFREEKADGGIVTLAEGFQTSTPLTTFELALGHRIGAESLGREMAPFIGDVAFLLQRDLTTVTACAPAAVLHEGAMARRLREAFAAMEELYEDWARMGEERLVGPEGIVRDWRGHLFEGTQGRMLVLCRIEGGGAETARELRVENLFGPVRVRVFQGHTGVFRSRWQLADGVLDLRLAEREGPVLLECPVSMPEALEGKNLQE